MSIEDAKSFHLYQQRLKAFDESSVHRRLKSHHHIENIEAGNDDEEQKKRDEAKKKAREIVVEKKKKKTAPKPSHNTQHGMMIDAGSQGTRIHVYQFNSRVLSHADEVKEAISGQKLSFPTTDTRWTNRLKPGLDAFAYVEDDGEMIQQVRDYITPLMNFSKTVLAEKEKHWGYYPIYLKATGGLRSLPRPYRLRLVKVVRDIFHDKSFNPFFFQDEHARVISGEEEAIYGWTAVNFAKNTLVQNSKGSGSVTEPGLTYGVLEMGGASAQIGFFEPNGDVMANLFKMQIGAAKHWNIYAHSWLYFGVNLAYDRYNARLYTEAMLADPNPKSNCSKVAEGVYSPCLPGGTQQLISSRVHYLQNGTLLPLSSPNNPGVLEADQYSAVMENKDPKGNYSKCYEIVRKLLRKEANSWCNFAHDRDCSFAGVYQPPLPIEEKYFGEFIATSNFYNVFQFLGLAGRASLSQLREKTQKICNMNIGELIAFNNMSEKPMSDMEELKRMCFRSSFVSAFLIEGVGFPESYNITTIDVINGQKLGWALGSMLYEINTLPWEIEKEMTSGLGLMALDGKPPDAHFLVGMFGLLLVVTLTGIANMVFRRGPSKRYRYEAIESTSLVQTNGGK